MILELSGGFPVNLLCEKMGIQRSSFYNWKHTLSHPAERTKALLSSLALFEEYHLRYPSHGYRWLNAKIRLDTGTVMSDPYAHKCCKTLGVKSGAKHYKYKKPGNPFKIYPNLLMTEMQIDRPLQCIVSDMTAFYVKGIYYQLTLYIDYLIGLKEQYPQYEMILHSDQGAVYASKAFNELLPMYSITRSMSRAGTPTDNAAMESINGWIKAEIFMDFHVTGESPVEQEVAAYITFFNTARPAYSLKYLTPQQYKEAYAPKDFITGVNAGS